MSRTPPFKELATMRINPGLLQRLKTEASAQGRPWIELLELAVAEYLMVPLSNPALPEQPVEICPACTNAVLWNHKCPRCKWRRPRKYELRAREQQRTPSANTPQPADKSIAHDQS